MRPSKRKSAAPEHVLILNEMRPSEDNSAAPKGSFAAPEHVNPKLTLDIPDSRMKSKKKGLKVKKKVGDLGTKFPNHLRQHCHTLHKIVVY